MEPLQPLCRGTVLDLALRIAKGMVLDRTTWVPHDTLPMNLAIAFRQQPNPSDEDLDTYAELSAMGKVVPKDLSARIKGFVLETIRTWATTSEEQHIQSVADGGIGAVATIHSCPYNDHLIVEVAFRDSPETCMHTALLFGAYTPEEGEDPDTAPPRVCMHSPWRQLFIDTDTFVRHPLLPRRFVPRMNTCKLWQPTPRINP